MNNVTFMGNPPFGGVIKYDVFINEKFVGYLCDNDMPVGSPHCWRFSHYVDGRQENAFAVFGDTLATLKRGVINFFNN